MNIDDFKRKRMAGAGRSRKILYVSGGDLRGVVETAGVCKFQRVCRKDIVAFKFYYVKLRMFCRQNAEDLPHRVNVQLNGA